MEVLTEKGLIINIMSFLDNKNCCRFSSVLNFGLTNKYFLNLLKIQKLFDVTNLKYYTLCQNTKNLLNNNLEVICTNCSKIKSLYGIKMLFRECKYYYNDDNNDLINLYMEKKGKSFFHFNSKDDCDKFKLDCKYLFPRVKLGGNCCSGNGIEVCLNEHI